VALVVAWAAGMWAMQVTLWPGRFAPARVPEFVIGVAAGVGYLKGSVPSRKWRILAETGGVLLLTLSLWGYLWAPACLTLGFLSAPGAALLIYGLAYGQGWMAQFFSQRWIGLLGMSSFAFYLLHDLFLRACEGIFKWCHIGVSAAGAQIAISVALYLSIQVVSICVFKKFEVPVQKFLRGLVRPKATGGRGLS